MFCHLKSRNKPSQNRIDERPAGHGRVGTPYLECKSAPIYPPSPQGRKRMGQPFSRARRLAENG